MAVLRAELAGLKQSIQTQRLEIVDEKGETRAVLTVVGDGPTLALYDEKGKVRAALGVVEGAPELRLYDAKGRPREGLTVCEDGAEEAS